MDVCSFAFQFLFFDFSFLNFSAEAFRDLVGTKEKQSVFSAQRGPRFSLTRSIVDIINMSSKVSELRLYISLAD